MKHNIYLYILVMAAVTYLIRVLPLTLIKKEIKNKTVRSFFLYFQKFKHPGFKLTPKQNASTRRCGRFCSMCHM